MNKNTLTYILLLITMALSALSFPDKKGEIIKDQKDFILRLVNTPNSSIKTAEAIFLVNNSSKNCFKVLNDIKNYPEFMPNITETKFISKNKNGSIYDFVFEVAFMDTEYSLLLTDNVDKDIYYIDWTFVKGEINDSQGSWIIKPISISISELHYKVYLDPGSFIPDWITNKLTARSIPDMVEAIRKRVSEIK
ncbi:MAG: hypothetical protein GQ534_12475 [Candidatus Delongbacteria bacterium]|nr:hypothetical protein [Candidatus Delongbacteria bacterium]